MAQKPMNLNNNAPVTDSVIQNKNFQQIGNMIPNFQNIQ
jgi:hypothetical protein